MNADLDEVLEAMARCRTLRENGVTEAVLRGEFQSRLRGMFPHSEDESWINRYSEGAEAHTTIAVDAHTEANRFIDNLVGATTIEYEADLRDAAKRQTGYMQVKEHLAGLIRLGIPISHVRGILSDTVEWHVYTAELLPDVVPKVCTPTDLQLTEMEDFRASAFDSAEAGSFAIFLRRHLARQQSHPLAADHLSIDLGLDSPAYRRNVAALIALVEQGRDEDSSVALATDLWSRFVDHLEGHQGPFRVQAYVDELYLTVLARLLAANALQGEAFTSDDDALTTILDGSHFQYAHRIDNLVEQDYFGWLTSSPHLAAVLPVAKEIQRDLYAYDFAVVLDDDLFGRLMAQVARRSRRRLLGQEWTPRWLADLLATRCIDDLPNGELPQVVDICCGSGAILAELIRVTRVRFECHDIRVLTAAVTGFDIDPLAVALAKTTWVVSLSSEINAATEPIKIPIYHADSLYAITPVSPVTALGNLNAIDIDFDGETVSLPASLVQPEYRHAFDRLVDWAHDTACDSDAPAPQPSHVSSVLEQALNELGVSMPQSLVDASINAIVDVAARMKSLAAEGRNGIWAFILRNTYRPGLLAGQFNGLVTNPPWLAMSVLADNPYRDALRHRARQYGVMPSGQSFLHLELATMHLLHGIDRYLQPTGAVACLVPGTVLNGHHHERLRQRGFLDGSRPVHFSISEVWQVAAGTFKYPGAALIGKRALTRDDADEPPPKAALALPSGVKPVELRIRDVGPDRTAWNLESDGLPAVTTAEPSVVAQQGADIMPRTAVCIDVLHDSEHESRVNTPGEDTAWAFTIKQAKQLAGERFPGWVAPRFIHRLAQSENLLPFVFGPHRPPVAIPAYRDNEATWRTYEPHAIRNMGFVRTAQRFQRINAELAQLGRGQPLEARIDERGKLTKQSFASSEYVVLAGAGGKFICAACIPTHEAGDLVIDQTLYWRAVPSEAEAWFSTGMLNSNALTEAILPFNPRGDFGPRHIHALPYRVMPPFDSSNSDHVQISQLARDLNAEAIHICQDEPEINDPRRALAVRRRKLRARLAKTALYAQLNQLCGMQLGTAAAQ